jgi:lysophospholipase L1-like esterase
MDSGQPTVRYYDARRTRPWHFAGLGMLLAVAAVAAWFGADLLRAEEPAAVGIVTVDGEFDEQAAQAGAQPVITAADPADDRIDATSMAMVGDSLTAGSSDAIRYTLTAHGMTTMDIDGVTSRRIVEGDGKGGRPLSGVATLYGMLGDPDIHPDVWVVALGTNDIGQYDDPQQYRDLIRTVLDMLPDDVPLVWVNAFRADRAQASSEFNLVLLDEVGKRDRSVVASWFDQASRDDETQVLQGDGVHPNQHGRVVFSALVAEGIAAVT